MAQSPGVGLHPTILREEGKNRVSEGNTRPAPPCSAFHKTHTRSLGESKTSHQQQQFLCLSYKPQGQIPKLLYSSSTLGFGSSQKFLHVPELPAHGWRNFVCSPNIKKAPIISNNHTRVFIAKTLLSHSCLCITALLKSHQRGFSQEISMLPEFP